MSRLLGSDLLIRLEIHNGPGIAVFERKIHHAFDQCAVRPKEGDRHFAPAAIPLGGFERPLEQRMCEHIAHDVSGSVKLFRFAPEYAAVVSRELLNHVSARIERHARKDGMDERAEAPT